MKGVRVIRPDKILSARGARTRPEIVRRSGGQFTEQDLYNWEKGLNLPRLEKQPYLLSALEVSIEDISDELTIEAG